MQLRERLFGYSLMENEKEIDIKTYLNNNIIKNSYHFMKFFNIKQNATEFAYLFSNNKLIGCPYQSLTDNEIIYQDITGITWNSGTSGLATGNTIEEALVQGSSELFERIVIEKFFNEIQDQYYLIDSTILNNDFQYKIKQLNVLGYDVYIYDLSYNFSLPVICLIIYNKNYKNCFIRFGSHPIFDIALERCFTEMFQGFIELPTTLNQINLEPYQKQNSYTYIKNTCIGTLVQTNDTIFPYYTLKYKIINKINSKYFLFSQQYTNHELLEYIKNILILNNYHFDWLNISKSSKIFAIHIIPRERLLTFSSKYSQSPEFSIKFTEQQQYNNIYIFQLIYNYLKQLKTIDTISYNKDNIKSALNKILTKIDNNIGSNNIFNFFHLLSPFLTNSLYKPFELKHTTAITNGFDNLIYLVTNVLDKIYFSIRDTRKFIWEQYKIFTTTNQIDENLIQNVFNYDNINFNNITEQNFYLIYLMYVYNFQKIYTSQEYSNFIYMLLSDENGTIKVNN